MKSIKHFYPNRCIWITDDGIYHREDGPAMEFINGTKKWFLNGAFHREDGPAIIWCDGPDEWWIKGHNLSDSILPWLSKNNMEDYEHWTIEQKILFKLTWVR